MFFCIVSGIIILLVQPNKYNNYSPSPNLSRILTLYELYKHFCILAMHPEAN